MGPFLLMADRERLRYFYGFIGGETNQYYPGSSRVRRRSNRRRLLQRAIRPEDMTDKAIAWIRRSAR
jgi:arylsulfatase